MLKEELNSQDLLFNLRDSDINENSTHEIFDKFLSSIYTDSQMKYERLKNKRLN